MKLSWMVALSTVMLLGTVGTAAAQKNKTTCGPDVPLVVTIGETRTAPNNMVLVSDGSGPYQNGVSRVEARFQVDNCTHDFTMNLNFTTRSMWALLPDGEFRGNFFNFDRIHSVPRPEHYDAFCASVVQKDAAGRIKSKLADDDSGRVEWYYDNYAGCGEDGHGKYVRRGGGISLDPDQRLGFRHSPIDNSANECTTEPKSVSCGSSYIRVYRTIDPATLKDTWVLRPEPGLDPDVTTDDALAAYSVWVNGKTGYRYEGHRNVPFVITVVPK